MKKIYGSVLVMEKHSQQDYPCKNCSWSLDPPWQSYRLYFSNNARKRPGYIKGPWFISPEEFLTSKEAETIDCDGHSTEVVASVKNKSGPMRRPGRIEGPWFCASISKSFPRNEITQEETDQLEAPESTVESLSNVEIISTVVPLPLLVAMNKMDIYIESGSPSATSIPGSSVTREPQETEPPVKAATSELIPPSSNVFTRMSVSFVSVNLDKRGYINTVEFLQACREILTILDLMGGMAFAPVKSDLNGNITKLATHYEADRETRGTLQEMVLGELAVTSSSGKVVLGIAAESLLWLKRSLTFVDGFLVELLQTEDETRECANRAYKSSLEQFHNFVVKTAFQVAVYALPSRKDFIATLADKKERMDDPAYVRNLMKSADDYSLSLRKIVMVLNEFYVEMKLE